MSIVRWGERMFFPSTWNCYGFAADNPLLYRLDAGLYALNSRKLLSQFNYHGIVDQYLGVCRSLQEFAGVFRSLQEFAGVCRSLQEFAGVCRRSWTLGII
jgi:hypothetical protein